MQAIALYARETPGFAERLDRSMTLLQQAAERHGGGLVQATSLGAEDMVVTDLIARLALPIDIATLETGRLHPQTSALIETIRQHYERPVQVFRPQAEAVVQFVRDNGEDPMYRSLALRKACCQLRKMEPLARLLDGRSGWVTGLRREQSSARGEVAFEEADADGRTKFNPLAEWRWADVWHYIQLRGVPYNRLHDAFMPSIGCAPCTRAIAVGEDFRSGRWWWESESAKECGLHVKDAAAPATELAAAASR